MRVFTNSTGDVQTTATALAMLPAGRGSPICLEPSNDQQVHICSRDTQGIPARSGAPKVTPAPCNCAVTLSYLRCGVQIVREMLTGDSIES